MTTTFDEQVKLIKTLLDKQKSNTTDRYIVIEIITEYNRLWDDYPDRFSKKCINVLREKLHQFYKELSTSHRRGVDEELVRLIKEILIKKYQYTYCVGQTVRNRPCANGKQTQNEKYICTTHKKRQEEILKCTNEYMIKDLSNIVDEYLV